MPYTVSVAGWPWPHMTLVLAPASRSRSLDHHRKCQKNSKDDERTFEETDRTSIVAARGPIHTELVGGYPRRDRGR